MAELMEITNEQVILRVQQKIKEKDEVIQELMTQLEEKEQSLKERDQLIQELQERINQLEKSAENREQLIAALNQVLD